MPQTLAPRILGLATRLRFDAMSSKKRKKKRKPSYEENMAKLAKRGPRDAYASGTDALSRRVPGSYESGKRR